MCIRDRDTSLGLWDHGGETARHEGRPRLTGSMWCVPNAPNKPKLHQAVDTPPGRAGGELEGTSLLSDAVALG